MCRLRQVQSVLQDQGEVISQLCDIQQHHRTHKVLLSLRPHGNLQRRRLQMVRTLRFTLCSAALCQLQDLTCAPSTLQAAHEELHTDWKSAFPGYPVVQPASDWLFGEQFRRGHQRCHRWVTERFISVTMLKKGLELNHHVFLCCRKVHEEAVWHKQRPDGHRPEGRPPRQQSERKQKTW